MTDTAGSAGQDRVTDSAAPRYHCLRCDRDVPADEVHEAEWMPGRIGTFHTCGDFAHEQAAYQQRLMRNELRICIDVSWWERLVERTGKAERWECLDRQGRWRRYWRRHGSLPKWAKP